MTKLTEELGDLAVPVSSFLALHVANMNAQAQRLVQQQAMNIHHTEREPKEEKKEEEYIPKHAKKKEWQQVSF